LGLAAGPGRPRSGSRRRGQKRAGALITVVLGGARSGKSAVAERVAAGLRPPVTYVATATATDDDFAARIAEHQARRPPTWQTVEAGSELPAVLGDVAGTALVDSLGTWVTATLHAGVDVDGLCDALADRAADTVVVTEEVGLAVHPPTDVGRQFVDVLGVVNQRIAALADEVLLVVAGRVLAL
jgi:adenosyl cobinamide kinase/adenosyl cobinamide phosphate guanylyltransferase